MAEEKTAGAGDGQPSTCILPEWEHNGLVKWKGIQNQKKSLDAQVVLLQPPIRVIPVIFLPGVMGTNLMSDGSSKREQPIWRGDSEVGVYFKWAGQDGNRRRKLLSPDTTKVDNRGDINQNIYSPFSDDGNLFPTRRERGWGGVLSFSYGKFLSVFQGALLDGWQRDMVNYAARVGGKGGILSQLVGARLSEDKATKIADESVMTQQELDHFRNFLFPLHVYGYNWLQDNKTSAEGLVDYIEEVIDLYTHQHCHGMAFPAGQEKVIIVTHSMGGLVARYASQISGAQDKILGIVHGVIPDIGSPAAYRRMKVGAKQEGMAGAVLGNTAQELMPVLARAPAPLQLLPSAKYLGGAPWLTVEGGNEDGTDIKLPKRRDPFSEIYLNETLWCRLYEADIIDKDAAEIKRNWNAYSDLISKAVQRFIEKLDNKYHPNTYAFYGHKIGSDGTLSWNRITQVYLKKTGDNDLKLPNNYREVPLPPHGAQVYRLGSSNTPGDGTVPVESLNAIRQSRSIKSVLATNVDHQGAYNVNSLNDIPNKPALKFTLRAIVKMVQEVPVP